MGLVVKGNPEGVYTMAYYAIIDTETAPIAPGAGISPAKSRVYDFGMAVMDGTTGRITETFNMVVEESWLNAGLMRSAYYKAKLPAYAERIRSGELEVAPMHEVFDRARGAMVKYGIKQIWAYNARFDYTALNATVEAFSGGFVKSFAPAGVQWLDIMSAAAMTICDTRKYREWCFANKELTASGRPTTRAEGVYRYITGDLKFVESHTALDDALIEASILAACFKRKRGAKKMGARWGIYCKAK